jgi:hypothetical protein
LFQLPEIPAITELSAEAASTAPGPSPQMMLFLQSQLEAALQSNLCNVIAKVNSDASDIASDSKSVDHDAGHEVKQDKAVLMHQDHFLLTLTILSNFVNSHHPVVLQFMKDKDTVRLLVSVLLCV